MRENRGDMPWRNLYEKSESKHGFIHLTQCMRSRDRTQTISSFHLTRFPIEVNWQYSRDICKPKQKYVASKKKKSKGKNLFRNNWGNYCINFKRYSLERSRFQPRPSFNISRSISTRMRSHVIIIQKIFLFLPFKNGYMTANNLYTISSQNTPIETFCVFDRNHKYSFTLRYKNRDSNSLTVFGSAVFWENSIRSTKQAPVYSNKDRRSLDCRDIGPTHFRGRSSRAQSR